MGILSKLFGPKIDISEWMKEGAIIVDVRTKNEFQSGHVKGSVNLPLDQLRSNSSKLDKKKPVITCCASGMRSATGKSILKTAGFERVYNGGSWTGLRKYGK